MTTYTTITNGQVDSGSPIDEALVTALRDNPLAIQEGDASAPKIQPPAFDSSGSAIEPWVLLHTDTTTGGSSLDFDSVDLSAYSEILVRFNGLSHASGTVAYRVRLGTGATYDSGANYSYDTVNGGSATTNANQWEIDASVVNTNIVLGMLRIWNHDNAVPTMMRSDVIEVETSGYTMVGNIVQLCNAEGTGTHNSFQIALSSSTFDFNNGVKVYGRYSV